MSTRSHNRYLPKSRILRWEVVDTLDHNYPIAGPFWRCSTAVSVAKALNFAIYIEKLDAKIRPAPRFMWGEDVAGNLQTLNP